LIAWLSLAISSAIERTSPDAPVIDAYSAVVCAETVVIRAFRSLIAPASVAACSIRFWRVARFSGAFAAADHADQNLSS
jgi:hypothetical protein